MTDATTMAHIIQLAVTPVFMIAGIGALLNVLTNRLGRVVDRGRWLEDQIENEGDGEPKERHMHEIGQIDARLIRINLSIASSTIAALLVSMVIVSLFTGELLKIDLSVIIAGLFISTMAALTLGLVFFLGEIAIASKTLRVTHAYRKKRHIQKRSP